MPARAGRAGRAGGAGQSVSVSSDLPYPPDLPYSPFEETTMLRKLTWLYVAGFLGIFLICHTPGLTDADGRLLGLFRIDPIDDIVHLLSGLAGVGVVLWAPQFMPLYFKVIGLLYDLDAVVGMTMSRGLDRKR